MCRVSKDYTARLSPVASLPGSHRSRTLSTSFQKASSIIAILSVFAYLRKNESAHEIPFDPQEKSLFQYILLIAFLFNIPRNLLEAAQFLKARWNKSSLHASISNGALRSLSHIPSSEALARLSGLPSTDGFREFSKSIKKSLDSYRWRATLKAITRPQCFARHSYIGKLSVTDIEILYRYASDVNQFDFDKKKFVSEQSKLLRAIITAIDLATKVSRGGLSKGPAILMDRKEGDVDALYFIAVTRIFAEWRLIRAVPKGYKAYATSIKLASRDLIQNLSKIEDGVHSYIKYQESIRQETQIKFIPSPTLRQLLQHEAETNVHHKLPRLEEQSVASGLLWTKRQIHYQLLIFRNFLKVPTEFPNAKEAVKAAYQEVYEKYHNWAMKQVFTHAIGVGPPLSDIWTTLNPPQNNCDDCETLDLASPLSLDSDDDDEEEDNVFLAVLEGFGKHLIDKWEDVLGQFNCIDGKKKEDRPKNLIQSSESYLQFVLDTQQPEMFSEANLSEDKEELNNNSFKNPLKASMEGADNFVKDVSPLLNDFESLLDQFNMNDPTRV